MTKLSSILHAQQDWPTIAKHILHVHLLDLIAAKEQHLQTEYSDLALGDST